MAEAKPNMSKCLQLIKFFEKENEKNKNAKDCALEEIQSLRKQLCILQKACNELKDQTVNSSTFEQQSVENVTIKTLTAQNLKLQQQLVALQGEEAVTDVIENTSLKEAIANYKEIIKQKNDQISFIQQNSGHSQLAQKVTTFQQLLQKTIAVNQSYTHEIVALKKKLDLYESTTNTETQAQAVSGDEDLNGSGNLDASKEVDLLKEKLTDLNSQVQKLTLQNKETLVRCDGLLAANLELEERNADLSKKNQLLSAKEVPLNSQMKIFLDDFYDERKEKEKQYKENQEMKEENEQLKKNYMDLLNRVKESENAFYRNEKVVYHQGSFSPSAKYQHPNFEESSHFEGTVQTHSKPIQDESFSNPINYSALDGGARNINPSQYPLHHQMSAPSQGSIGEPQDPVRKIGFPPHPARYPTPASPPFHQQISASQASQLQQHPPYMQRPPAFNAARPPPNYVSLDYQKYHETHYGQRLVHPVKSQPETEESKPHTEYKS